MVFLQVLEEIFLVFHVLIMAVTYPLSLLKRTNLNRASENCKASFAVVSDIHYIPVLRDFMVGRGLSDMEKAGDKLDALVINGDITDNGLENTWDFFSREMARHNPAEQTILTLGNHDSWNHDDNMNEITEIFRKYNSLISNRDIESTYYSTEIGGYPAIILSSDMSTGTVAVISDTETEWFRAEMAKAGKTGLPIFIFCHYSLNLTHGLPFNWELNSEETNVNTGGIFNSDEILSIIKQYKNVFFISGHIHEGFSVEKEGNNYVSVEKHDGYTLINVPCYITYDLRRGGYKNCGCGYVFEIYEDEVLIRARRFSEGYWLPKYDVTVELK